MFGLTHAYISSRVLNSLDKRVLLGSIASDLIWNSDILKKQANFHKRAKDFFQYCQKYYPNNLLFAKGIILHSDTTGGIDSYSDNPTTGYAFIQGKLIFNDVKTSLKMDYKQALDFSHNFVEGALDVLLARDKPSFVKQFNRICSDTQYLEYVPIIASFGGVSQMQVKKAFETLLQFYIRTNYTSVSETVQRSLVPIAVNRFKQKSYDVQVLERIFKLTIDFVQPTYQLEIAHIIEDIKRNTQLMSLLG